MAKPGTERKTTLLTSKIDCLIDRSCDQADYSMPLHTANTNTHECSDLNSSGNNTSSIAWLFKDRVQMAKLISELWWFESNNSIFQMTNSTPWHPYMRHVHQARHHTPETHDAPWPLRNAIWLYQSVQSSDNMCSHKSFRKKVFNGSFCYMLWPNMSLLVTFLWTPFWYVFLWDSML